MHIYIHVYLDFSFSLNIILPRKSHLQIQNTESKVFKYCCICCFIVQENVSEKKNSISFECHHSILSSWSIDLTQQISHKFCEMLFNKSLTILCKWIHLQIIPSTRLISWSIGKNMTHHFCDPADISLFSLCLKCFFINIKKQNIKIPLNSFPINNVIG